MLLGHSCTKGTQIGQYKFITFMDVEQCGVLQPANVPKKEKVLCNTILICAEAIYAGNAFQ